MNKVARKSTEKSFHWKILELDHLILVSIHKCQCKISHQHQQNSEHSEMLKSMNNLMSVLDSQYEIAEQMQSQTLEMTEKMCPGQSLTVRSLDNLAVTL